MTRTQKKQAHKAHFFLLMFNMLFVDVVFELSVLCSKYILKMFWVKTETLRNFFTLKLAQKHYVVL